MLKSLSENMNNENDKWLEKSLKEDSNIADNGFSANILEKIENENLKKMHLRKTILNISYVISFAIFALLAPWGFITEQSNLLLTQVTSIESNAALPITALAVIFITFFTTFILLQESDN